MRDTAGLNKLSFDSATKGKQFPADPYQNKYIRQGTDTRPAAKKGVLANNLCPFYDSSSLEESPDHNQEACATKRSECKGARYPEIK